MQDLGKRIEFHSHTTLSDGLLLPAGLVREAEIRDHAAIAITDHVDASNFEFVIKSILKFVNEQGPELGITVIPGVELSYITPSQIPFYAEKAKQLGAKIVIVHGESPVEPVYPGTNHAAVKLKGLVDILAHPGEITEEDTLLAKQHGIYLELSAKHGHKLGNKHVAAIATAWGADLLVNTDAHSETGLITQIEAYAVAKAAGLKKEAIIKAIKDNPQALLKRISK
ncbi:MAG: histidinol phosphate phosphatase domain-containing protein [Candidatus Saganbacteria bacterium]|nr:histidinol phosphate phosphatase domain-containing protein [Candidatus Saganbacteria bacterium]